MCRFVGGMRCLGKEMAGVSALLVERGDEAASLGRYGQTRNDVVRSQCRDGGRYCSRGVYRSTMGVKGVAGKVPPTKAARLPYTGWAAAPWPTTTVPNPKFGQVVHTTASIPRSLRPLSNLAVPVKTRLSEPRQRSGLAAGGFASRMICSTPLAWARMPRHSP